MRFASLLASLALCLGACAAAPPPSGTTAVAADGTAPPPMPESIHAADFDRMVAADVLRPLELPALSHEELDVPDADEDAAEAGILVLTSWLPGGSTETAYLDHAGRIWIVVHSSRMDFPDGVSISATRMFRTRHRLPAGTRVAGTIRIVESAAEIPRAAVPRAPAA